MEGERLLDVLARDGLGRGVALRGTVWTGGSAQSEPAAVVVAGDGRVVEVAPQAPDGLPVVDAAWIGPGVVDAHVHLAFGSVEDCLRGGVVGVRDLGAPPDDAASWRGPTVAVAGPILTATGGYPSRSWGADGFAVFADTPEDVRKLVARLDADVVKIALEPGPGWPVPALPVVRAAVEAAHDRGLPVVAHALRVDLVQRALEAGVDELAHTPTERLPDPVVDLVAASGVAVTSTLQTFFSGGAGRAAAANAADLHRAGVRLLYGTDLGNAGTRPGVDPRELDRLAAAGLGRLGALRAATEGSAHAAGMPGGGPTGLIEPGRPAAVVLLAGDPLIEPGVWRRPVAVLAGGRLLVP